MKSVSVFFLMKERMKFLSTFLSISVFAFGSTAAFAQDDGCDDDANYFLRAQGFSGRVDDRKLSPPEHAGKGANNGKAGRLSKEKQKGLDNLFVGSGLKVAVGDFEELEDFAAQNPEFDPEEDDVDGYGGGRRLWEWIWTEWTSEEYGITDTSKAYSSTDPEIAYPAIGLQCSGSYCDNIRLAYTKLRNAGVPYGSWYSPWFSEESGGGAYTCPDGYYMTQVYCSGKYCDNKSFKCTRFSKIAGRQHTCHWSNWFSEEGLAHRVSPDKLLTGMQCKGSYCDNVRLKFCKYSHTVDIAC